MKKIVIQKPGNYNQLRMVECPNPTPGPTEILVETHAAGVNFADCLVRMGVYQSAKEFVGWPITPGFEVSGIVRAVGEGITKFKVGQRVMALTLFNGYSTHVLAHEDKTFLLPEGIDFATGAAIPTIFLTAYYALFELGHPRKGSKILVHSAAGGVGSSLVQLAKIAGCYTVGVVGSSQKVDYVKKLGADVVIDKSTQKLWDEIRKTDPDGFDIILDANGIETLRESYNHLNLGGKLIIYGFHTMFSKGLGRPNWFKLIWDYLRTPRFNPLKMTNDNHSVMAFNLSYMLEKKEILLEAMSTLLSWIEEKKIQPPLVKTYQLEHVADAQRDLESGKTIGKLVLVMPKDI